MGYNFDRPFTFDRVVRLLISLALIGFGIYLIYILSSALLPFLIAWLIAYLLNPIVRFIQKNLRIRKRAFAVTLTFILVLSVLVVAYIIISPSVEREIFQINTLINTYKLESFDVDGLPVSVHDFIVNNIDFNSLKEAFSKENATETVKYIVPALQGFLTNSISFILGFTVVFIVILYLIFILLDYDKVNKLWMDLIPPKYRGFVSKLTIDVEKSMNTYFRHQALICLIVAILYAVAFQIIGLPLAIIMGLLIGVLHMVPYLHAISFVPAVLLCWLKVAQTGQSFWALVGLVFMIYVIIQCIIDIILVPRIMGKAMGLNPAIILLSLSIWGSLMGIVGMIIAIPMTTLLLSYYQNFINTVSDDAAEDFAEKQDQKLLDE
jgi:predicted PurR-regulated permease PerM